MKEEKDVKNLKNISLENLYYKENVYSTLTKLK